VIVTIIDEYINRRKIKATINLTKTELKAAIEATPTLAIAQQAVTVPQLFK